MLIPPRRLNQWTMVPGTRTTYAGVVPLVINRGVFEAGMASVVIAYPTTERSDPLQQGVRLEFRWVLQLVYTSFWAADPTEPGIGAAGTTFALNVLDDSPLVGEFTAAYSDPEGWEWVFGDHRPEDLIRHFHIVFDDFGTYDVLAVDCVARNFPLSPSEQRPWDPSASAVEHAAEQAQDEVLLLGDAMALDPLPPILSYPFKQGPPP
jgi:hypothetical protein